VTRPMRKPTFLGPLVGKGPGQCELVNPDSGSVLASQVEPAFDSKARKRGLLGRDSLPPDAVLVLAPCSAVHTFSMRFPIDILFVARNGTVLKACREVKPRRLAGAWRASAVIEAAAGFIERTEIVPGEAVALREIPERRRATDVLPSVVAAPAAAAAGGTKARQTGRPGRATLADIIAQGIPRAWFESIAIVQEMCELVLARGPAHDPRVPELRHIAITQEGAVELLAEGPAEHSPVHRASLVLLALTPEAELPTQLRLLALEEVSPRPKLGNLRDLHKELEFFERPDRRSIIQGVYERYLAQTAPAETPAAIPPPLLEPPPPRRKWRWWMSRNLWAGVGIVLLTAAVGAAVWAWPRPEGRWMRQGVSEISAAASSAARFVAGKASEQAEAIKWRLKLNRQPPRPLPDIRADVRAPAPVAPTGGVAIQAPAAGSPQLPAQTLPVGALQPDVSAPPAPTAVAVPSGAAEAAPPQPAAGPPPATRETVPLPAASTVYSSADPLVVPPELVRPSLPSGPPPGVRLEDLPQVEVVVSATGEVESVRLVSPGTGPRPAMMLAAVKAWRFKPATRGGQPVAYRTRLRLPAS